MRLIRAHFHPDPPALPPSADPAPADLPAGDPPAGDPPTEKMVPQSQVNLIVEQRLAQDRERRKAEAEAEKKRIEAEAAKRNGEWETVAKSHESTIAEKDKRIAELESAIASRDREALCSRIGAELNLPRALWSRLVGTTEEEIRADAQAVAKDLPPPTAPRIDPGRPGSGGAGGDVYSRVRQQAEADQKAKAEQKNGGAKPLEDRLGIAPAAR